MTDQLDRRLNAFRDGLADMRLKGRVDAPRFVEGKPARVRVPVADLLRQPERGGPVDTQLLMGEDVRVFDTAGGFSWVQAGADGYVGYLETGHLGTSHADASHRVTALSTFSYAGPDLKTARTARLSMGSLVACDDETETRGLLYRRLADGSGWIVAKHLSARDDAAPDWVAVAEMFVNVPYLWGGRSAFGVDCSGLVQLAMAMAGRRVLRDTDMQEAGVGTPVEGGAEASLGRGDLVFWRGHVGIMRDAATLLHANGNTMTVASEPLAAVIARIRPMFGEPTAVRRPDT